MRKILKAEQVSVCVCVRAHVFPNGLPSISCTLSIYCLLLYITLTAGTQAEALGGRGLLGCLM